MRMEPARNPTGIAMVGFDADDTLWRSQDYFDEAQAQFERIVSAYVDLGDVGKRLYEYESRNIAFFGYGVKGMALSMVEAAVEITGARISAGDIHRIVVLAKELLRHPVEVLDGVREAVAAVAAEHPVVLVTKGDLFHQEQKMRSAVGVFYGGKALKYKDYGEKWRRSGRHSCGPVRPDMAHSCPDFAPIMEAA